MLISDGYLDLQRQMHAAPKGYGQKGDKWAEVVAELAAPAGIATILDYGCGQGALGRALRDRGLTVGEYDPAIKAKADRPAPADLVVCTDVLEHIEPDCIEAVLDDLVRVTRRKCFLVIALTEAGKVLPDGRNAHILLRPVEWWMERLSARFDFDRPVPCRSHKEFAAVWRAL